MKPEITRHVEEIELLEEAIVPKGTSMVGLFKTDDDYRIPAGYRLRMKTDGKLSIYDNEGRKDIAYPIFSEQIWNIAKQYRHIFRVVGIREVAEEIVSIEKDNTIPKPVAGPDVPQDQPTEQTPQSETKDENKTYKDEK